TRIGPSAPAITKQGVSNPRGRVPNKRRRRRPPHGRRTGPTGEWPPAARRSPPAPAKDAQGWEALENFAGQPYRHDMVTILCALVSIFAFRFRSRASLELRLLALHISWQSYADSGARTHLSLDKDCPRPRAVQLPCACRKSDSAILVMKAAEDRP